MTKIMGITAAVAALYVFVALPKVESDYSLLPLLPLGYGILLLISHNLPKILHRISVGMLVAALTVRYVLSPVLMVGFEAYGTFGTVQPSSAAMRTAILLMLYEMICIFGVLEILGSRWLGPEPVPEPAIRRFAPARGQIVVPILLVVGATILAIDPPVMRDYRIFTEAVGDYVDSRLARSEGAGYVALIIEWARLTGCLFIVNWLWTRFRQRRSKAFVGLSILGFLPVLIISSRTSRTSILFPAVAALLLLISLYRPWKKAIVVSVAALLLAVLVTITISKNFGDQLPQRGVKQTEMATRFIHSYGSPVQRVADSIETAQVFHYRVPGWRAFLADTLTAVPLLGRLATTSDETTTTLYNISVYAGGRSRDQIVPMIGQSLYHWGLAAAPLYSILLLLFAFRLDFTISRERRPEFIYIHTLLMFRLAAGSLLGNWTNCVTDAVTIWLPLFCIFWLNRTLVFERKLPAFRPALSRSHVH